MLAFIGAAGAAPVGSVMPGAGAAPAVDVASTDARSFSSPAACGGVAGVVVNARSGPGVVWLVFLFFFFFFFFFFFSSFFSLASLERRGKKRLRKR
jgi:hypothetical protein